MKKTFIILIIICSFISLNKSFVFTYLYPLKYVHIIRVNATENKIPEELVASIINVESGFNPYAKSKSNAIGLMQILPSTAKYVCELFNIEYDAEKLYNPSYNIKIGCLYIKYLSLKFSNINTMMCAYNAGETIVRSWLKNQEYSNDGISLYSVPYDETSQYVVRIDNGIKFYMNRI